MRTEARVGLLEEEFEIGLPPKKEEEEEEELLFIFGEKKRIRIILGECENMKQSG